MGDFKYRVGVLGGTFDNLHKGHKFFIKSSFTYAENLIIGLTSDSFLKGKKLAQNIESFNIRKKNLVTFLELNNFAERYEIVKIEDIYGITLKQKNIEAIFVTPDTLGNAFKINIERKKINLPEIDIVKINLIEDELQKPISSTNIRVGSINDFGHYYNKIFKSKKEFILNQSYREDFKKPIGKIIKEFDAHIFTNKFIIAVGDVAVAMLLENNIKPNIGIFDLITKREKVSDTVKSFLPKDYVTFENKQGTINSKTALELEKLIRKSVKSDKKYYIKIIGEEDLLTIPAILFSPIGSIVFYGLRNVGGIAVNVDLNKKKEIEKNYLPKFEDQN